MPEQSRVEVLHCHDCGESRRVESTGKPPRCVPANQTGGFVIDHVEVLVTGRCPSCVTGRSAAPVAGRSAAPVAGRSAAPVAGRSAAPVAEAG